MKFATQIKPQLHESPVIRIAASFGCLAGLFVFAQYLQEEIHVQQMLQWARSQGAAAPVVFTLLYIPTAGIIVPSIVLKIAAGTFFNVFWGFVIISVGSTVSSIIMFLTVRYFMRDSIRVKFEHNAKFKALNELINEDGWKIIALLRNVPIVSAALINCAAALTNISLKDFITSSWVGRIPSTLMYAYLGHMAGMAAVSSQYLAARSMVDWTILLIGMVATLILSDACYRHARKTLQNKYAFD